LIAVGVAKLILCRSLMLMGVLCGRTDTKIGECNADIHR